jgi:hypothetical protein
MQTRGDMPSDETLKRKKNTRAAHARGVGTLHKASVAVQSKGNGVKQARRTHRRLARVAPFQNSAFGSESAATQLRQRSCIRGYG